GLTAINAIGLTPGRWTQNLLTIVEVTGLLLVILAGLLWALPADAGAAIEAGSAAASTTASSTSWGLAMVFVMLTYGGWNEAAYISAEMREGRSIARALVLSLGVVTGLYLLVN